VADQDPLTEKSEPHLRRESVVQMGLTKQVLLSSGLLFTVAAIIVCNMPNSALTDQLNRSVRPYVNFTGIYQDWSVFANPRTISAYVFARVDYSDGNSSVYPMPAGWGLAAYTDYRWIKFEEHLRPDTGEWHWPAYARYVAEQTRDEGRDPVRVALIRRWAETLPPGPGPEHGPWHEFTMFVMPVKGER
jgi:hypothetical protein